MSPDHRRGRLARADGARAVGIALGVVGLALVVWLAGWGGVLDALRGVSPRRAAELAAAGGAPLVVWGWSLRVVLTGVGVAVPAWEALLLFVASVFLNGVTPFGQAGGDPPSGLLVAGVTEATFEQGLAAITSVNALNRVAVVAVGVVGAATLAGRVAGVVGETVLSVVSLAVGVTLGVVALVALGWRHRDVVVAVGGDAVASVVVRVGDVLPWVSTPSRASVVGRVRGFVDALERLAGEPWRLGAAFLLGVAGQVAVAGVLWLALDALGAAVPVGVVLVVVPVAKLGGLTPLPGGTGGSEALLTGLLVTAGVALPVAAAAALLYRAAAFWLPTVVGGVVTVALLASAGRR